MIEIVIQVSGPNAVAAHCLTSFVLAALLVGAWRLGRWVADLLAFGVAFVCKRWGW